MADLQIAGSTWPDWAFSVYYEHRTNSHMPESLNSLGADDRFRCTIIKLDQRAGLSFDSGRSVQQDEISLKPRLDLAGCAGRKGEARPPIRLHPTS